MTEKLLFSLTVVSAVIGGCKTPSGGSPSSTGFEPGAVEAADPSASTLLLFAAELGTTLLLAALGFPFEWFIVLLAHAKRDVGRWLCGCSLATSPHAHANSFVRKRNMCEPQSFLRIYIHTWYIRDVFDVVDKSPKVYTQLAREGVVLTQDSDNM